MIGAGPAVRRASTVTLLAILLLIVLAALAGLRRLRRAVTAAEDVSHGTVARAAPDSPLTRSSGRVTHRTSSGPAAGAGAQARPRGRQSRSAAYTSGHGPEAFLIEPDGTVAGRWRQPYERAFPGAHGGSDLAYFRRAVPLPDGGLAALFQGGGVVRLDVRSRLVGAWRGATFNDIWPLPGGGYLVLPNEARTVPEMVRAEVLEDTSPAPRGPSGAERVAPQGSRLPFGDPRAASTGEDILRQHHQVLGGRAGGRRSRRGETISLPRDRTMAIVDPAAGRAVWAARPGGGRRADAPLPPDPPLRQPGLDGASQCSRSINSRAIAELGRRAGRRSREAGTADGRERQHDGRRVGGAGRSRSGRGVVWSS